MGLHIKLVVALGVMLLISWILYQLIKVIFLSDKLRSDQLFDENAPALMKRIFGGGQQGRIVVLLATTAVSIQFVVQLFHIYHLVILISFT